MFKREAWAQSLIILLPFIVGLVLVFFAPIILRYQKRACPGSGKTTQQFRQDFIDCMDGRPIVDRENGNRQDEINRCMIAKGHVVQRGWCDLPIPD